MLLSPSLVKYFKRAHFVLRPDHKGHIRIPKGMVPLGRGLVRTLVFALPVSSAVWLPQPRSQAVPTSSL